MCRSQPEYPNKPPKVRFVSHVFHPNVYADGQICLDILQSKWSPIYDVAALLASIQSMLHDPNPASPANSEAARLFSENRAEYDKRVRAAVEESWLPAGGGTSSSSSSSSSSANAPSAGGGAAS